MLTIIYIGLIIALLYGAGAIPARWLFGAQSRLRTIAAPVLGFGLIVILVQDLYSLGAPVKRQAPYLVILILAALAIDWFWSRRASVSQPSGSSSVAVWACGALAVLLCGWPAIYAGHKTYMAYANPDANNYQFTADRYLNYSVRDPIAMDGYHPGNYEVKYTLDNHERSGADKYLALVSAACDLSSKGGFAIAVCSLVFLVPLSVYLFAILGLEMEHRGALVITLGAAVSSLLGLIAYQQLLGNLGGAVLLPATLGAILNCVRKCGWRIILVTALLCAALLSVYPEMFLTLGPTVVGAVVWAGWRMRIQGIIRNIVVSSVWVVVGILALNPLWGYYGIQMMLRQTSGNGGGDSYAFAFSRAIVPVGFGLLPFPVAAGHFGGIVIPAFRAAGYLLGCLCILATGFYLVKTPRSYRDSVITGSLAGLAVPAVYLVLRLQYSYGFFKVVMFSEYIILTAVAVGAVTLWDNRTVTAGIPLKYLGGTLFLLLVVFNIASAGWYGAATLSKSNQGIVNEVSLSVDPSFDELEELERVVTPQEAVMVDTSSGVVQMWAVYGLRRVRVSLVEPLLYFEPWTRGGAADFTHNYDDRYVLRETKAFTDIVEPSGRTIPVWRSPRFELDVFRDHVAVGRNWYGLERGGLYPWRWLNTDGEILLIRPSEKRYRFSFVTSPGPGVRGDLRHISVVVNGETVWQQAVSGTTATVTTPLTPMDQKVNHILIRIAEKPALIPTDTRLLNVAIGKVRVQGEQEFREAIAEDQPDGITVAKLNRFLGVMRDGYSDTWVGPDAQIPLWNRDSLGRLQLEGEIPPWSGFRFPVAIAVDVNGVKAGTVKVAAAGKFVGAIDIPHRLHGVEALQVSLHTDHSFTGVGRGLNSDTRRLSFFFSALRLSASSVSIEGSKH